MPADAAATATDAIDGPGNEVRHRLEALGYVGLTRPAPPSADDTEPVPSDQVAVLESYRAAADFATRRQWLRVVDSLQRVVTHDPQSADVWRRLGAAWSLAGRYDRAADAYRRAAVLEPGDPGAPLGAAAALLQAGRLAEARAHAEAAVPLAGESGVETAARAHELLARIALGQRDADGARAHAEAALGLEPGRPLSEYVEGRLLSDRRRYEEALPHFERAMAALSDPATRPIADLHATAAEGLVSLERYDEAERAFLDEIERFPYNLRARAGLASLHHATDRAGEAADVIADLLVVHPTPDGYRAAARLWTAFGQPKQAAVVRAEAVRAFPPDRPSLPDIPN
jgi:tetratricopeptide (TPR) repeat protein